MVAAVAVMAGAAAASALLNYINGEKARGAASAEIDRLTQIYNKIQAPQFDKFGVPRPTFDMSQLTPEDYQVVAQYVPEAAARIEEVNPTIVRETSSMAEGRNAQLAALRKLSGISQQEQDPELMQKLNMASQRAQQEAQSRGQSILQDENRRGMLGSGMAAALKQNAGIGSMQQAAMTSQDAATQAYKNRLSAMMQGAELGGDIRNQDISLQGKNADIINAFNQRTTKASQDLEQQRINALNQAHLYNAKTAQGVAEENVTARNRSAVENRARNDALAKYGSEWEREAQKYKNKLAQDEFGNDMDIANAQSGLGKTRIGNIYSSAQDRANIITGVGGAVSSIAGYAGGQASLDDIQKREDARAIYHKTGKWPTSAAAPGTYNPSIPPAMGDPKKNIWEPEEKDTMWNT